MGRPALREAGAAPEAVAAIGVTSQRLGLVFLDKGGGELYSGPNVDLRAAFEGAAIDEKLGQRQYETTGHFPSLLLAPAKLEWFRCQKPDLCARVSTVQV